MALTFLNGQHPIGCDWLTEDEDSSSDLAVCCSFHSFVDRSFWSSGCSIFLRGTRTQLGSYVIPQSSNGISGEDDHAKSYTTTPRTSTILVGHHTTRWDRSNHRRFLHSSWDFLGLLRQPVAAAAAESLVTALFSPPFCPFLAKVHTPHCCV